MKRFYEILKINLIILFFIILSNLFNFRICLIYNLFHIPCPGCGATRASYLLLTGNFVESIKYSLLPLILIIILLILFIWSLIDYITKKYTLKSYIIKNKKIFIIISVFLTIMLWIRNIYNSYLY